MSYRHNELNMTTALTTNFFLGNFYTTTVTDNTLISDTFVLSTGTLIVLCRTEDALTEETVALRFISTIVDGFRLGNLAIRIFLNLLG